MPVRREASLSPSSELNTPTSNRISVIRSSTPKTPKSSQNQKQQQHPPIEWAASCVFTMQWKELNVNAQMSNTMGNTTLHVRNGLLRGHLNISPKRYRDIAVTFKLLSTHLNAQGGAISGEVAISKLLISIRHKKLEEKAPENTAKLEFKNIESRIEWMSRPIFIAKFVDPKIILSDEWRYNRDAKDIVTESTCLINVAGSWTNLEMIITKMTVDDLTKIVKKLHAFFDEQIKNSRMMWVTELEQQRRDAQNRRISLTFEKEPALANAIQNLPQASSVSSFGSTFSETISNATSSVPVDHYLDRHWHRVLDLITNIQMSKAFFPLPGTSEGITLTGGTIEFEAKSISLACMNGEMSAPSWALFHMREASIDVRNTAKYTYLDDEHSVVGINMEQKFMFKLGSANLTQSETHDSKAVVCRVQHGRHFMIRNNASIEMWLDSMIGDPLRHLNFTDGTKDSPKHSHNVLELFQFPALEAILTTIQNQGNEPASDPMENVKSSFVCEFHSAVCVQTDFNAQVGFLPDLLKSYTHSPSDGPLISEAKDSRVQRAKELNPLDPDEKRDPRKYECLQWIVDPKIRFIDRFKWNPPVVDQILRQLQIFDHRTTIPKVMQRGVLDRCDSLLAALLENVVIKLALKE
uniref:Bridge-like lipid transfer protein family member 1 C-terminal domain-containing protein n=1 Tax=Panagrolaimus sp. ES5 TaxID=591445 RepID=A0AC34FMJ5_9BILA